MKIVMKNSTMKVPSGKTVNNGMYITAIIPAHNEGARIADAISSIRDYVDWIIVACDNCSDDTKQKAKKAGADIVFNTRNNHHRKAGALNQALNSYYVCWGMVNQYFLIMDADTKIVDPRTWFTKATSLVYPNRLMLSHKARMMTPLQRFKLRYLHPIKYRKLFKNRAYDCVGSIFQANKHLGNDNFIEEGQRLEWIDYRNKIGRSRKTFVLTGTCSLISETMMRKVHHLYKNREFYNDRSITEDFWMTIDLKECHARLISPACCLCITATKPSVKALITQRRRWYMGALQLVENYRIDDVVLPYLGQQAMLFISVFAYILFIAESIYLYSIGSVTLTVFWSLIFIGFDVDQTMRVWKYSDLFDKLYSASMIGWLAYSLVLDFAYIEAVVMIVHNKKIYWNSKVQYKNSRPRYKLSGRDDRHA